MGDKILPDHRFDPGVAVTVPQASGMRVLLVEDDPGDVVMIQEAFTEALPASLDVVGDGDAALAFLHREPPYADAPRPDLVLLDLNLPRRDGREVLAAIKTDSALEHIPVIVLTTSGSHEDVLNSYRLQANGYITKPVTADTFMEVIRQIEHFFGSVARLPPSSE
jgi:CheY-like chemotaxis protein